MKFFALLSMAVMALASPPNKIDDSRILGGTKVDAGQVKFMAAVEIAPLLGILNPYKLACGGIILNENTVLTAATCVTGSLSTALSLKQVRVGSLTKEQGGQILKIEKIIEHPNHVGYDKNNLAILKLSTNIEMGPQAGQIELYPSTEFEHKDVTAAGWGGTVELNKITGRVHGWTYCYAHIAGGLTYDEFCAFGNGIGNCKEDIGGPAFMPTDGVEMLVGLILGSNKCSGEILYRPQTYLNLPRYKDWINANI